MQPLESADRNSSLLAVELLPPALKPEAWSDLESPTPTMNPLDSKQVNKLLKEFLTPLTLLTEGQSISIVPASQMVLTNLSDKIVRFDTQPNVLVHLLREITDLSNATRHDLAGSFPLTKELLEHPPAEISEPQYIHWTRNTATSSINPSRLPIGLMDPDWRWNFYSSTDKDPTSNPNITLERDESSSRTRRIKSNRSAPEPTSNLLDQAPSEMIELQIQVARSITKKYGYIERVCEDVSFSNINQRIEVGKIESKEVASDLAEYLSKQFPDHKVWHGSFKGTAGEQLGYFVMVAPKG